MALACRIKNALLAALCAGALTAPAHAGITGGSANFVDLSGSEPRIVGDNSINANRSLFGFDESTVTLTHRLQADWATSGWRGKQLTAGTDVASHLVYFDPLSRASLSGFVTFDGPILGLIYSTPRLVGSTPLLGLDDVRYAFKNGARLEPSRDSFSVVGNRLNLLLTDRNPGDYIRVLTAAVPAVPEPSTYAMIGAGLLCIGWMTHRRLG